MRYELSFQETVYCVKMQGSGNDFVLLPGKELNLAVEEMPDWARAICKRGFGLGADGLIILDSAPENSRVDYKWHFFNADGSRAEMCGNGSRCAARLAFEMGLASQSHVIGTDAGPIRAEIVPGTNEVSVQLTRASNTELHILLQEGGVEKEVHFVNTGVPHTVLISEEADRENLSQLGPWIRYHLRFAPEGCNVNIMQLTREGIYLRTYERGVEDETYACGTGAAAAAYIAGQLGLAGESLQVTTSGGENLTVALQGEDIFLRGKAEIICQGELNLPALGLGLK